MVARTIRRQKVAKNLQPRKKLPIISTEYVPILDLNPYYKNPRIGDVEKVAESLAAHGQFKTIVVNRGTKTGRLNEILGGNHTWLAARKLNWDDIFVAWVDVDDDKAAQIVLADNGTSDGSTYDDSILTELLSNIKKNTGTLVGTTYTDDVLSRLVKDVTADPTSKIDKIEDASDILNGVEDLSDGVIFPSNAAYDMPELRLDMIPAGPIEPLDVWAGHELDLPRQEADPDIKWLTIWHRGNRGVNWKNAIACFYTEDFHFEPVFEHPAMNTKKILNLGMLASMMPNYSVNPDWPIATWIWAAYRSAYVGRYMQEAGLPVIPDIQYGTEDMALDITLLCIPENAGLVATQVQNARGDDSKIRTIARLLKESEDRLHFKNIIVYGHTDADRVLERADLTANVIRVDAVTARRREYLDSGATLASTKVPTKKRVVRRARKP